MHEARGILVPGPGIKATPPAAGVLSLNHWTTWGKSQFIEEASNPCFTSFSEHL